VVTRRGKCRCYTVLQYFFIVLTIGVVFCEALCLLPDDTVVVPRRVDFVSPHNIFHTLNRLHVVCEDAMQIVLGDSLIAGFHGHRETV